MLHPVLAALSWNPQIKGALIVLTAVLILCGSVYLILSTNTGARLGFLIAAAGLAGWMAVMGIVWTVYGIGLKGTAPAWEIVAVVQGDVGRAAQAELAGFPKGWKPLKLDSPETAEAQEMRFQEKENIFSTYLPYAIVFGCTEKWARAFRGLAEQAQPMYLPWYVGHGTFSPPGIGPATRISAPGAGFLSKSSSFTIAWSCSAVPPGISPITLNESAGSVTLARTSSSTVTGCLCWINRTRRL